MKWILEQTETTAGYLKACPVRFAAGLTCIIGARGAGMGSGMHIDLVRQDGQKRSVAYHSEPCWLTNRSTPTAALLRFGVNMKSLVWAAAGERGRYAERNLISEPAYGR